MPEGHLIHRHAREQHTALSGRTVRASSPQGRFEAGPYDGRTLTEVEALGKHLLYHFENGLPAIHVHLGMRGIYLHHDDPTTPPRPGTRLRLATDNTAYDLIAPIRCEPMDAPAVATLRDSLGPDPLRDDASPSEAVRRLTSFRGPVGAGVLDQGVWAGIGNAWRAELLFLVGIHPGTRNVDASTALRLWEAAATYLALGRDAGQVVSDPSAPDERWVYKREHCRRCGTPVETWQLASRTAYACPHDQPP
ncbi:Formamidopyrimidine-DNA glycosylase [[Actinomadura] parvosata subsp. kistnae]|uniref:DNA-(apurinic or apyrimidinic site) lyase n=1 Tax=[Actinomadura] parvosata subsp. kistnae TaxID=1909395 RepID=A0A1V0AGR0_9ACTN|nr:DNA-formamidopyrimidine glycosylase family protein [Nonomuraea sp. ATCC 55076]AQZ69407.1 formamidopyrimidine-DNA glycolase [Nonomuraea sp. ATCC 55076]SPL91951.1 Formamidopyrimidine-DNA glycosylase [Actinomadura parvosata subsp. kistnae]